MSSASTVLTTDDGTGHIITKICDANQKTIVEFAAETDAVGHIKITAGATGVPPKIEVVSSDTNASLNLSAKGAGTLQQAGVAFTKYVTDTLIDIYGAASTDAENADASALALNGNFVAAETVVAASAWTVGALTSPDVPRNVCIEVDNDTGGTLNLYEGVMTFTVTGTDRLGATLTETITFTSTNGNKGIATTKFRAKYGVKAFKTVTAVMLDHVPADGLKIGVGIGTKIAILNTLVTPAESDVLRASKQATNYVFSGFINTTYNTINFQTIANGDDLIVAYRTI